MKPIIYLFAIALLVATLTAHATVSSDTKPVPVDPGPALPINTNVVYLVIAGLAIGIFIVRKSKQAEAYVR